MTGSGPPFEVFPGRELGIELQPGFPDVHESYRGLRDQKDMVCGPYTLTYLLRAYGFERVDGVPITVDSVAAAAGTALEEQNEKRRAAVEEKVATGSVPQERAGTWSPHDHYEYPLGVAEEGGCSPEGLIRACESITSGKVTAVPIPAVVDDTVQLTAGRFGTVLSAALDDSFGAHLVFNYNLRQTLAPTGLLGHKYNPLALLTHWDEPGYFRTLDWDVGHFTSLAGRVTHTESGRQYLLVRDSYRSFGWNGYHLQPRSYVRDGLVREEDHRDGGILLLSPADTAGQLETYLAESGLTTGHWDNGSPYLPETDPFE
jgi:hypothetical protein